MQKFFKVKLWRGLTVVMAALLGILSGVGLTMFANEGAINQALGIVVTAPVGNGPTVYPTSYTEDGRISAEGAKKLLDDAMAQAVAETEEGAVLLCNNGALPLDEDERGISLFGRASVDPIYAGNSGGPSAEESRKVDFKRAFTEGGFTINQPLYDAYAALDLKRNIDQAQGPADIAEAPVSFYSDTVRATYANEYKDAAIVVLSRLSGEGHDMSVSDSEGVPTLALHPSEKAMLEEVQKGGFGKTIVLLNSVAPIETDELAAYDVDACLWIGYPGFYGLPGIVNILKGEVNPSGHLVDTFAANSLSSPAMMNWGDYSYAGQTAAKYVVELEGIYYGYKYYETRYEDSVLGQGGAASAAGKYASEGNSWNYADEVSYPFGHGLSYTSFSQKIVPNEDGSLYAYDANSQEFTIRVEVTNTGNVAGKSVVQLYAQQPYGAYEREYLVEKSSVQIVGFEKTPLLSPSGEEGSSATVDIKVPLYFLASYDEHGAGTYILSEGEYYFSIGDDAHDALNNIIASKKDAGADVGELIDADGNVVEGNAEKAAVYSVEELDTTTFATSPYTGEEVYNRFDYVDINYYYEGTEQEQTYLTRQDWAGTYPKSVEGLEYLNAIKTDMNMLTYANEGKPSGAPGLSEVVYGVDSGLHLADMVDIGMDTEEEQKQWEKLVQQMSIDELCKSTTDTFQSKAISSVGKPQATHTEGPTGVLGKYQVGDLGQTTGFAGNPVLAATWNKELMRSRGLIEGEEALYAGVSAFFSPGVNVHRTPYLGRYYDYFCEDGIFSYIAVSQITNALTEKGMISCMKHFTANDMETNRQGVCTFMSEQRLRQESMRAFEGGFTVGNSLGTMSSYNRIGCVQTQASRELLTDVLRGEWGFKGIVITDAKGESNESPSVESVMAGVTMFCQSNREITLRKAVNDNDDGALLLALQSAAKYNLYAYAHSNLVNGLTSEMVVSDMWAWWQYSVVAIIAAVGVIAAGCFVIYILSRYVIGKGPKGEKHE